MGLTELKRALEIYGRELGKAVDQAKSYRELIKATKEKIKVQEAADAEIAAAAEAEAALLAES